MLLRELQSLLIGLYALEFPLDVRDFLFVDDGASRAGSAGDGSRHIEESLLIEEQEDEIALALCLDAAVLSRLAHRDPRECLCECNLHDFCTVVEGISHFNCVGWNAAGDRQVTLLELEMQAEIDKYLSARVLLARQRGGDLCRRLLAQLFDGQRFDARLGTSACERYRSANRLAMEYCRSLESRFPAGAPAPAMLRELRSFYRHAQPEKLSRIRAAALS